MKRFDYINTYGTVGYTPAEIAAMTDTELAAAIREEPDWNPALLEDLIWRAFPEYDEPWEVGDPICYDAARALGVPIG